MIPPERKIILVTPVYNDSARLALFGKQLSVALAAWDLDLLWLISDDGSTAAERGAYETLVRGFRQHYPHVHCIGQQQHIGKGAAVYFAWDSVLAQTHYAFVDADGAIDCQTLKSLIDHAIQTPQQVILGIRKKTPTTEVRMSSLRWLTHHTYAAVVRRLLKIPFRDPQCGVKILPADAYRKVRPKLSELGMAFDAELLFHLHASGIKAKEVPINWMDQPKGSFKPFSGMPKMLHGLWNIRVRATGM